VELDKTQPNQEYLGELDKTQPSQEYLGELDKTQPSQEYLGEKVHNIVATNVVSQLATDTKLDKAREDSSKTGQRYLGESAEFSMWPGQLILTEV
jgi:hypothetical protein